MSVYVDTLLYVCPHRDLSLVERQTDCMTPCHWFPLGTPPCSTLGPPLLYPVTRQGVRGLIICTDPGLSPQGGCLGTVALDPIDMVRGRRRGEENRPWLQSVGPPRQVDECPGLHDLCHPSQWSQATMSYSLYVRKTLLPATTAPPPPPPTKTNPRAPQPPPEPELAGLPPSANTGGLSLTAPLRLPPPPPPSPFQLSALTAPILSGNAHSQVQPQAGTGPLGMPFHCTSSCLRQVAQVCMCSCPAPDCNGNSVVELII